MNTMIWLENYSIMSFIILSYIILYLSRRKTLSLIERHIKKKLFLDFLIRLASNFRFRINNIWKDFILPIVTVLIFDSIITIIFIDSIFLRNFVLPPAIQIINLTLLHPVTEEILMRGFLFGAFFLNLGEFIGERMLNNRMAIYSSLYKLYIIATLVIQAYIFAYYHSNLTYLNFLIRFISGLLYGFLYIYSKRNLLPPILAHAIHNLYALLI